MSEGLLRVAAAQLVAASTTGQWATTADQLYDLDPTLETSAFPLFSPVPTQPDHVHLDVDGPLLYLGEVSEGGCSYLLLDLEALDERREAFDATCRSARMQSFGEG